MRMKIRQNLKTTSLSPKFTGSWKKKVSKQELVILNVFECIN